MSDHQNTKRLFEKAYEDFFEQIFRFLYIRLGDRERAKELAQDTFMRTWLYVQKGNTIENMRPFLYTTAHNLFKNELRGKRDTLSLEVLMEGSYFEPSSDSLPPEELLEQKMAFAHIEKLPKPYNEALTLRYVDGLAITEIAEVLGETATAISVRIHRGIQKIREMYHHEKQQPR